jgi:hypothetical protein
MRFLAVAVLALIWEVLEEACLMAFLTEDIDTLQMEKISEFKLLFHFKELLPVAKKRYE